MTLPWMVQTPTPLAGSAGVPDFLNRLPVLSGQPAPVVVRAPMPVAPMTPGGAVTGPVRGGGVTPPKPPRGAGGGGGAAGGAARAGAMRGLARIAGGLYLGDGVMDVVSDYRNPESALNQQIARAIGEWQVNRQQGTPLAESLGAATRGIAGVVGETAKSFLLPNDTMAFVRGLLGGNAAPRAPQISASLAVPQSAGPAPVARPTGRTPIGIDQFTAIAQVLPRMAPAQPVAGRDLAYNRAIAGLDQEFLAIQQDPTLTPQQRGKMVRDVMQQYQALAMNVNPALLSMLPDEDE